MKYIMFNDKKVDTNLFLQLQDLASVLTKESEIEFAYHYGHMVSRSDNKITASQFWENRPQIEKVAGLKTDIYLRAIGTLRFTEEATYYDYKRLMHEETHVRKFASQLFTALEDIRLEEICKRERPGTRKLFEVRSEVYRKYFQSQFVTNRQMTYQLDAFFCLIYLNLIANSPFFTMEEASPKHEALLEQIRPFLFEVYEAPSTKDIIRISTNIVFYLQSHFEKDAMNEYFVSPFFTSNLTEEGLAFADLKRKDRLRNDDHAKEEKKDAEGKDESFSMWHRETESKNKDETFLQFELENGTKTNIMGNAAREGDEADEALASVQGVAKQSKKKDYSKLELLQKGEASGRSGTAYGEENKHAVKVDKFASKPTIKENLTYQELVSQTDSDRRKLANTIEKTLEHRKSQPSRDLLYGRLSKKLLPAAFEEMPRIFYKKRSPSTEIDAVFTLLVDCSASMHDKMDETKKGIILFHEVLKKLRIVHSIVGFWEDANEVREKYQPNYFHHITTFADSLYVHGSEILQLTPEEDNRDGYSIRVMTEMLQLRREKHKFLLIFSDGEPAADHYDQNGIVDTHEAVLNARKKGVDVIGMFLANEEVAESDEITMKNIYGKEHLLIPKVEDLTEQFAPLLKKLILKSI